MARETNNYTMLLYNACVDHWMRAVIAMQIFAYILWSLHFLHTLLLAVLNSWIFKNI